MTKFNEYVMRFGLALGLGVAFGGFLIHQSLPWLIYLLLIVYCVLVDLYFLVRRMFPPQMKQWAVTMKHRKEPLTHVVEERARTAKEAADWALIKHKDSHERWNWTATAKPWKTAEEYAEDEHADYILKQVAERAKTDKISLWKSARITLEILAKEADRKVSWPQSLFSVCLIWFAANIRKLREGDKKDDAQH